MSSGGFLRGSERSAGVLYDLNHAQDVNGKHYDIVLLHTPSLAVTDTCDPDARYTPEAAALYWPGGHPNNGGQLELLSSDALGRWRQTPEPKAAKIRTGILGARIGEAALSKILAEKPALQNDTWAASAIFAESQLCLARKLPFAVCQFSKTVRSGTAKPTRIMQLWYPDTISPKPILECLKSVVKTTAGEETAYDKLIQLMRRAQ